MKKEKQRGALLICFRRKYKTVYFINQIKIILNFASQEICIRQEIEDETFRLENIYGKNFIRHYHSVDSNRCIGG